MCDRVPVLLFGRLGVEPVGLFCLGTFASSVGANDRLFSTHAVRLPLHHLDCSTSSRAPRSVDQPFSPNRRERRSITIVTAMKSTPNPEIAIDTTVVSTPVASSTVAVLGSVTWSVAVPRQVPPSSTATACQVPTSVSDATIENVNGSAPLRSSGRTLAGWSSRVRRTWVGVYPWPVNVKRVPGGPDDGETPSGHDAPSAGADGNSRSPSKTAAAAAARIRVLFIASPCLRAPRTPRDLQELNGRHVRHQ